MAAPKTYDVVAILVVEPKLGNVQQHVLFAHLVECADNAALEDRP
jgi:hypothetical protein